jgi:hypothetical protein
MSKFTLTSLVSAAGYAAGYTEAKIEIATKATQNCRIKGMKPTTFVRALGKTKVKHIPAFLMGDPTTTVIHTPNTDPKDFS